MTEAAYKALIHAALAALAEFADTVDLDANDRTVSGRLSASTARELGEAVDVARRETRAGL